MFTKIRIFIKKHFPAGYARIRSVLFPYASARRRRKAKQFIEPHLQTISIHGASFALQIDPANGFVDRNIYTSGVYEPDILHVIKEHLTPGDTFVDIGANIGQHALFAAHTVGDHGHVIAFEPIPQLIKQMQTSIAANGYEDRVTLHQIGCSDDARTEQLHLNPTNMGGSSMHVQSKAHQGTLAIKLDQADKYLKDQVRVDLIKIDTEGHEYEVLCGLEHTLATHKPKIILEYSPTFRSATDADNDSLALLQKRGYTVYDLENGHRPIKDLATWKNTFTKRQTNVLCIMH